MKQRMKGVATGHPQDSGEEEETLLRPTASAEAAPQRRRPFPNRLYIAMTHTSRYSIEGQARLAMDVNVSRSTISRLVRGRNEPSYRLAQAVTDALAKALKRPLDPRELFSPDGTYPTPSGCTLCGCKGCMPDEAYDCRGNMKPAFQNLKPGDWTLSPSSADYDSLSIAPSR